MKKEDIIIQKLDTMYQEFRGELDYIHNRVDQVFDKLSGQLGELDSQKTRIGKIERVIYVLKQALGGFDKSL